MFFDLPPEPETQTPAKKTNLQRLEAFIADGSLARRVEQKQLGNALVSVHQGLTQNQVTERLAAMQRVVPVAQSHLSRRDEVFSTIGKISVLAGLLQNANAREDLERISKEQLYFIDSWLKQIEGHLKEAWQKRISEDFGTVGSLAILLHRFQDSRKAGLTLQATTTRGLALQTSFPPSGEQIILLITLLAEREKILTDLREQEETADLLQFLDKVMAEQATLADVSPKLWNWLTKNNALSLLKIQL